jgi:hypothetical protein
MLLAGVPTDSGARAGRQGIQDFTPPPPGRPAFPNLGVRHPGVQVQGLNISAATQRRALADNAAGTRQESQLATCEIPATVHRLPGA